MRVYLERIDPAAGMARFYIVAVLPTLFGEWAVLREWGRIGQRGTVRQELCGTVEEALVAANNLTERKQRKGYR